jgi:putative FmdB family regulatory protein
MPIYDWRCVICGYVKVDVLHPADLDKCEKCGSRSWSKLPSAPAGFKGLPTEKFYPKGEK